MKEGENNKSVHFNALQCSLDLDVTRELGGQLKKRLMCVEAVVTLRARTEPGQEEQMQNIQLLDLKSKLCRKKENYYI